MPKQLMFLILALPLLTLGADLRITEIMPNPEGNDEQREWFETVNFGSSVEVKTGRSGWLIFDGKNHYVQNQNFSWNTNEAIIFTQDKPKFLQDYPGVAVKIIESSFYLKNSEGTIKILDEKKNVLAEAIYKDSSTEGYSLIENDGGWRLSNKKNGTPGIYPEPEQSTPTSASEPTQSTPAPTSKNQSSAPDSKPQVPTPASQQLASNQSNQQPPITQNPKLQDKPQPPEVKIPANKSQPPATSFQSPAAPPQVLINEFLPNAKGKDEAEFIELVNLTGGKVSLANLSLKIGEKKIRPQGETDQKYITLWKKDYGFNLRNKGEIVSLWWTDKEIHRISYQGSALENKSFAKIGSNWFWTKPSPGEENVLVENEPSVLSRAKTNRQPLNTIDQASINYQSAETNNLASVEKVINPDPKNTASKFNPFFIGFVVAIILAAAVIALLK